jgi:hypothetical protein
MLIPEHTCDNRLHIDIAYDVVAFCPLVSCLRHLQKHWPVMAFDALWLLLPSKASHLDHATAHQREPQSQLTREVRSCHQTSNTDVVSSSAYQEPMICASSSNPSEQEYRRRQRPSSDLDLVRPAQQGFEQLDTAVVEPD